MDGKENFTELSEKEYIDIFVNDISKYFKIYKEVAGVGLFGRKRIDLVIQPKDTSGWKDGANTFFGVECKKFEDHSLRYKASQLTQCFKYSFTKFGKTKRQIPILALRGNYLYMDSSDRDRIWNFLNQFNIGEFYNDSHYGWTICFASIHRMWSQNEGVHEGKRRSFLPDSKGLQIIDAQLNDF